MRLSPAQEVRARKLAAIALAKSGTSASAAVAAARPETGPEHSAYELLRAQFGEHLRQLSDLKGVDDKIKAKRQMIDVYDDHVEAVLLASESTGKGLQDEIFAVIMIWRIDIGDYPMALDMAEHVLKYGLTLPERYNRTPATLIVEDIAEAATKALNLKSDFPLPVLQRLEQIAEPLNINDIVRMKLHKALGVCFMALADHMADPEAEHKESVPAGAVGAARTQALKHHRRAYELAPKKAGNIKSIQALERALAKEPASLPEA